MVIHRGKIIYFEGPTKETSLSLVKEVMGEDLCHSLKWYFRTHEANIDGKRAYRSAMAAVLVTK